jgi:hypothetical protein
MNVRWPSAGVIGLGHSENTLEWASGSSCGLPLPSSSVIRSCRRTSQIASVCLISGSIYPIGINATIKSSLSTWWELKRNDDDDDDDDDDDSFSAITAWWSHTSDCSNNYLHRKNRAPVENLCTLSAKRAFSWCFSRTTREPLVIQAEHAVEKKL